MLKQLRASASSPDGRIELARVLPVDKNPRAIGSQHSRRTHFDTKIVSPQALLIVIVIALFTRPVGWLPMRSVNCMLIQAGEGTGSCLLSASARTSEGIAGRQEPTCQRLALKWTLQRVDSLPVPTSRWWGIAIEQGSFLACRTWVVCKKRIQAHLAHAGSGKTLRLWQLLRGRLPSVWAGSSSPACEKQSTRTVLFASRVQLNCPMSAESSLQELRSQGLQISSQLC